GAARDAFTHAREVLEREMNSATDNPLVFAKSGDVVSGAPSAAPSGRGGRTASSLPTSRPRGRSSTAKRCPARSPTSPRAGAYNSSVPAVVSGPRVVRAARGTGLRCSGWPQEAALRMLENNLDPEVAEKPDELIVYGGTGKAARNWECFDAIVASLKRLSARETLLVQSGKPVGVFETHEDAPRVLIANALLVPAWATGDEFRKLEAAGLTMFGQM